MGTSGFDALKAKVSEMADDLDEDVADAASDGLETVKTDAQHELSQNDTNATYQLDGSLTVEQSGSEASLVVDAPHGALTEFGTGPQFGDGGYAIPQSVNGYSAPSGVSSDLVNDIDEWIDAKGITPREVSREQLPWAIAQSIVENGTPAQPYLRPAWYQNKPWLLNGVKRRLRREVRK